MKPYQIIILIGSILGLVVTLIAALTYSMLDSFVDNNNSSSTVETNPVTEQDMRTYSGFAIGILAYIVILVIAFAVKHTKVVGILTIITSFVVFVATGGFGILGFVLLLAGGIVALATKKDKKPLVTQEEEKK